MHILTVLFALSVSSLAKNSCVARDNFRDNICYIHGTFMFASY